MKEAVENLVGKLVGDSEAVEVSTNTEGKTTIIDVRVAEDDMGRLIGRRGRTIRAIRSLLYYSGQKQHQKFVLNILED
jgi:predicted RNA-binding protein YlqC (UPF0109 family)